MAVTYIVYRSVNYCKFSEGYLSDIYQNCFNMHSLSPSNSTFRGYILRELANNGHTCLDTYIEV